MTYTRDLKGFFYDFFVISTQKSMISLGWPSAPRIPLPQPPVASAKSLPNFKRIHSKKC